MKPAAFIAAIAASAFALPAAAQTALTPSTNNFYVGATFGQSHFKDVCNAAEVAGASSCDNTDHAWRLLAGLQMSPNFSAEIGYHDLGAASIRNANVDTSAEVKLWEIVAIGAIPFQQFSVYGKVGGYRADTSGSSAFGSSDESTNGWTYGVGAGFEATKNLGLRLEWQQYRDVGSGGGANINVASVGVLWRFR